VTLLKWLIGIGIFLLWMAWAGAFRLGDRDRGRLGPTLRLAGLLLGLLLFVLVLGLLSAVGQIPAGTRGVVLRFGAPTGRILPEGIYLITPLVESVVEMSVQTEAYEADAEAASNDLQVVHTKVT
jgi:regulator of protease activity HflC (stomatin/prohibitin superfamily)